VLAMAVWLVEASPRHRDAKGQACASMPPGLAVVNAARSKVCRSVESDCRHPMNRSIIRPLPLTSLYFQLNGSPAMPWKNWAPTSSTTPSKQQP